MLALVSIVGIAPHPPIIIPQIGAKDLGKVQKTVDGMKKLAQAFREAAPDLLILITPHGQVNPGGPAVLDLASATGDFGLFGHSGIRVTMEMDREMLDLLANDLNFGKAKPVLYNNPHQGLFRSGKELDHGAMVPLYYLHEAGVQTAGLHITFSWQPLEVLYQFGLDLARLVSTRGAKAAVLASGDLSHRLFPGAPAGFSERGREYDELVTGLLKNGRVEEILKIDPELIEAAGECGLRSFVIGLGLLEGHPFNTEIISYEGPFGVGYLVAALKPI